jgi:succinate dehydrogenase iron-sulfur subunit
MAEFTLKVRRFQPEAREGPYWETFDVDLDPTLSVLDGILQAKDRDDGSLAVRCSCRAAICGSCGMKVNGQSTLACKTMIGEAQEFANRANGGSEPIVVEPMGNMPVIKDLVTDMESTHWTKIRRVTPWLLPEGDPPEREYVVPPESMIDITQSMACIQCGACVSACLSMEADPDFIGPAALAKAYRFVGDPRDAQQFERLKDLAEDPHGIYDCTHCFKCIDACPKGVAPMSQIMRLRRRAGDDHGIVDRNNGKRHEQAFVSLVRDNGLLWEAELLPRSYGGDSFFGKFAPPAALELVDSLPVITKALLRRKVTPMGALKPHKLPKEDRRQLKRLYDTIEGHDERFELNLYISGVDEDEAAAEGEGMPSAPGGNPHGSAE